MLMKVCAQSAFQVKKKTEPHITDLVNTTNQQTETYDLYAQDLPSSDLGIIDPKTTELQLTVAGRELTIHQSPGILSSARAGGTTGAGA